MNLKDINLFDPELPLQEFLSVVTHASFPKALNYKIFLALPKISDKSKGGIFLTDSFKESALYGNNIGRIVSIGETVGLGNGGSVQQCTSLKVGDYVKYNPHAFEPLELGGVRFIFVLDDQISAVTPDLSLLTDGIFKSYVEGVSNV